MQDQLRLAGCIIQDANSKVYLLHRIKHSQWEVPGGKIDEVVGGKIVHSGRNPEEVAATEIQEELKADVHIVRELGDREFEDKNGFICHYTWYEAKLKDNTEPQIGEPDKFDKLRAFSKSELHAMRDQLSSNTRNFLDAWEAGEFTLK
jgi:8-oxo-dGTP pyrophosphatase MutT (NUDIX family)